MIILRLGKGKEVVITVKSLNAVDDYNVGDMKSCYVTLATHYYVVLNVCLI